MVTNGFWQIDLLPMRLHLGPVLRHLLETLSHKVVGMSTVMSCVRPQYGELPGNRHWTCTSTTREAIRSLQDPLLLPISGLQRHNEKQSK